MRSRRGLGRLSHVYTLIPSNNPCISVDPILPFDYNLITPDLRLRMRIRAQIDYFFSIDNLIRDKYLRRKMDEQGWVPVNVIANFKKVSCLTDNVEVILDAMQTSTIVEVQGEKMRRRNGWNTWRIPN